MTHRTRRASSRGLTPGVGLGLALALPLLLAMVACPPQAPAVGTAGRPLVMLLAPSHAPTGGPAALAPLEAALGAATGVAVAVRVAPTAVAAIEAFGRQRADVGLFSVTEYLFTRQQYGVEARLQVLRDEAKSRYAGEILVRADGPLRSLSDLAGKTLACADEMSTSGFLLPAALLADAGVGVEVVFAGSHEAALARLMAGQADAAAVYHGAARDAGAVRVLAETASIPNEPVFVRRGLDPALATKVLAGLQAFAASPEGPAVLGRLAAARRFAPVTDAAYDALREQVARAGRSVADLVPSGRFIAGANNAVLGAE
jgi:phosphonate transport system substrate-binding protein